MVQISKDSRYNGNITEMTWKSSGDGVLKRYSYQYDAYNRLVSAIYQEPESFVPQNGFYNESMSYDANGNITGLKRNQKGYTGTVEEIDELVYSYPNGNRLASVVDLKNNYGGYPETSGNIISYDDNGSMTSHIDKGILEIKYNILDLPSYVKFNNYVRRTTGDVYQNMSYSYRADGVKVKKVHHYFSGRNRVDTFGITDYVDGFQYDNEQFGLTGQSVLKFFSTSEGYFDYVNNRYIYHYNDHLGNVRVSFAREGNTAVIVQQNDYYAFGLRHNGNAVDISGTNYKYEYNGKELQEELGMYDYGARFYMPDIGRWGVIDPLAEMYTRHSPYHYAVNNPMRFIDPDGRSAHTFTGQDAQNVFSYFLNGGSIGDFNGNNFNSFGGQGSNLSENFNYIDPGGSSGGGGSYYDIYIGIDGKVNKVNGDSKNYHRFFDSRGKQMFFNDPNGVNKNWIDRKYNEGDQIYYSISIDAVLKAINNVESNNKIRFLRKIGAFGAANALIAKESLRASGADFSAGFISEHIGEDGKYVYQNDSSYNIRFGNSNIMFSLMDAGNAMWGLWTYSLGLPNVEIKAASQVYEVIWNQSFDSPADQRAIFYFRNMLKNK
ncbi:RHS repeat-associated core domain [Chryseobacterium taihuense]|uniref:RHS repeat-associated core domain n=1 Tax=Chryseobacterium taihuense TaxID=1141221 RepID=A0A4U8WLF6_9FLAO|nr:RHS repeat-associated core domain [Chryseobacterium taihuense]